jgi:hypothetical protein
LLVDGQLDARYGWVFAGRPVPEDDHAVLAAEVRAERRIAGGEGMTERNAGGVGTLDGMLGVLGIEAGM